MTNADKAASATSSTSRGPSSATTVPGRPRPGGPGMPRLRVRRSARDDARPGRQGARHHDRRPEGRPRPRARSIADIAKAKNVDVNKVIDALVADATTQHRQGGHRQAPHPGAGRQDQGRAEDRDHEPREQRLPEAPVGPAFGFGGRARHGGSATTVRTRRRAPRRHRPRRRRRTTSSDARIRSVAHCRRVDRRA